MADAPPLWHGVNFAADTPPPTRHSTQGGAPPGGFYPLVPTALPPLQAQQPGSDAGAGGASSSTSTSARTTADDVTAGCTDQAAPPHAHARSSAFTSSIALTATSASAHTKAPAFRQPAALYSSPDAHTALYGTSSSTDESSSSPSAPPSPENVRHSLPHDPVEGSFVMHLPVESHDASVLLVPSDVKQKLRAEYGRQQVQKVKTWKEVAVRLVPLCRGGHWGIWTLAFTTAVVGLYLFMAGEYEFVRPLSIGDGSIEQADSEQGYGPHDLGHWLMFWRQSRFYTFSFDYLLLWGGRYAPELRDGQWWRWLSSVWLHQSPTHIVSNMVLFLVLAAHLEHVYGVLRVFPVWLLTGLAGNLCSAYFENPCVMVVGASGTIFGLLGMYLADCVLNFESIPCIWLRLLGLGACGTFVVVMQVTDKTMTLGGVSHASHAGGFVMGLCLSVFLLPDLKARRLAQVRDMLVKLGLGDRLPQAKEPAGSQLYSMWQRYRFALYALYLAAATLIALIFIAVPIYLYIKQLPHVTCPP